MEELFCSKNIYNEHYDTIQIIILYYIYTLYEGLLKVSSLSSVSS